MGQPPAFPPQNPRPGASPSAGWTRKHDVGAVDDTYLRSQTAEQAGSDPGKGGAGGDRKRNKLSITLRVSRVVLLFLLRSEPQPSVSLSQRRGDLPQHLEICPQMSG